MSLMAKLESRAESGRPVRVGLIGAGKFGSMYLSQVQRTRGVHMVGIADLSPQRARDALERVGWDSSRFGAGGFDDALSSGTTFITEDAEKLIACESIDLIIEATGHPGAGVRHALLCCEHRKHVVMVNVEADVLAGPLLAARAREAGIIYSMASGDQPALIAELIDWARTCGFDVVCAGKGTRYLPTYHQSTPDTVWQHYGFTEEQVRGGDFNAQMFNSFLDGTKSALEMAAVSNACGLRPPANGLEFPACGADDLPTLLRPREDGGVLAQRGTVEVVSSLERDGRPVYRDLRWGVYVVIEALTAYVRDCFAQYGLKSDASGRYAAMYKPYHLIGLELGASVASVALRGEPTGSTRGFHGDVVACAKRTLRVGERLDGEGGYTAYGKLLPATTSLAAEGLPIGVAHGMVLFNDVAAGEIVRWSDVRYESGRQDVDIRREMESMFRGQPTHA